jgi:hypothetical protein
LKVSLRVAFKTIKSNHSITILLDEKVHHFSSRGGEFPYLTGAMRWCEVVLSFIVVDPTSMLALVKRPDLKLSKVKTPAHFITNVLLNHSMMELR